MESTKVETLQAIERHQVRLATVLQYKRMFEMAKAMGENDEAARVVQMMKDYNRAHPPEASSSVSTASSIVPNEVQTLFPAAPVVQAVASETSLAIAVAGEAGGGSTAYQTEETLTESNQNSTAV
jgi:hypothetical protein